MDAEVIQLEAWFAQPCVLFTYAVCKNKKYVPSHIFDLLMLFVRAWARVFRLYKPIFDRVDYAYFFQMQRKFLFNVYNNMIIKMKI